MSATYPQFLAGKMPLALASGIEPSEIDPSLFDFQQAITRWAVRRGRAAIFASTGLGKTHMQLEWARQIGGPTLILTPLAVAEQTAGIASAMGIEARVVRDQAQVGSAINLANYELLHRFHPGAFRSLVLDESSIIKSVAGVTRNKLVTDWTAVPYRLSCTATPAPNDLEELSNQAEFLGVCTRREMLSTYFKHDDEGWRIKGHAREAFYRWLASWACYISKPSDLGFSDERFDLPALDIREEHVAVDWVPNGTLFPHLEKGIQGRHLARRGSLEARVARAHEIISASWLTPSTSKTTTAKTAPNGLPNRPNITGRIAKTGSPTTASTTPGIGSASEPSSATTETEMLTQSKSVADSITSATRIDTSRPPRTGPLPIPRNAEPRDSRSTDSRQTNTTASSQGKVGSAPSVDSSPSASAGMDSTSTTTTSPAGSEESSAAPVTSSSVSSETSHSGSAPLPTTSKRQWIVWCGLNDEQDALAKLLGPDCVSVQGSDSVEEKTARINRWKAGEVAVMVSKPSVMGWGLNLQQCHQMLFLGLGDSFEAYFQAIRRCWRFGQTEPVDVVIVLSEAESKVAENVWRKEREHEETVAAVVAAMREAERHEITGQTAPDPVAYETDEAAGDGWRLLLGDCCERLREIESRSVGLSIHSPPFAQLYTYSASMRDLGNCRDYPDFFEHYRYAVRELLRVTMPGRRACVHVQQIAMTQVMQGIIAWRDFRAEVVKLYVDEGWIYHGEVVVDKDPQAQAIRTKSKALLFVQKNKDSSWSIPAMADYILLFRAPGENPVPVKTDVSNEEWIQWARPIWYSIRESATLQASAARAEKDEKHIAVLQLETVERCVRLWSNRGELICDPFAGIGTTGHVALQHGRRFVGIELKPEYWQQARLNLDAAITQGSLFAQQEAGS